MAVKTPDTIDILKDIVNSMTPTVVIQKTVDNGDGTFTLDIFDTFWLRSLSKITIEGNVYQVISFIINESITIKEITAGAGAPAATQFELAKPHFVHGTPLKGAQEQGVKKSASQRVPFIWVFEVLKEKALHDRASKWGRSSSPRIYFMDEAQSKDWSTAQHKTNIGEPMRQMVELFTKKINDEPGLYERIEQPDQIALNDWGTLIQNAGFVARIANEPLTGHEVSFDFKMSKKLCDPRQAIPQVECEILITSIDVENETGTGLNDGTVTVNFAGDQGVITFLWTTIDGSIPAGEETMQTMEGLSPGTYTVVVSDSIKGGCTDTDNVTVDEFSGQLFAADFNTANYLSSSDSFFNFSGVFSFSGWYWFNSLAGSTTILSKFGPTGDFSYLLREANSRLQLFASGDGTALTNIMSTSSISTMAWQHYAIFFDFPNNLIGISNNGEPFATVSHTTGMFASLVDFQYGAANGASILNGRLDSSAVWDNKVLTNSDVTALYNSGNGQTFDDMNKTSLEAFYKKNELTGSREDFVNGFDLDDINNVGRETGHILD